MRDSPLRREVGVSTPAKGCIVNEGFSPGRILSAIFVPMPPFSASCESRSLQTDPSPGFRRSGCFDELDVEGDGDFFADQHAAGFKGRIPVETEVLPVDLSSR